MTPRRCFTAMLAIGVAATPAAAQPGPWGADSWGRPALRDRAGWHNDVRDRHDEREGQVDVSTFAVDGAQASLLGHGSLAVSARGSELADEREAATYEAAVIDRLIAAGYSTAGPEADALQIAELSLRHAVIEPAESKRKPISGETAIGVSNRGTSMGLRLDIDLTKPEAALVSTRLEARLRDRESGQVLWEGRAEMKRREDDSRWTDQAVARRLAEALFSRFPGADAQSFTYN